MESGGAERQLFLLAEGQVSSGHRVHVALRRGGPHLERLRQSGATVHELGSVGNHDVRIGWELRRLTGAMRIDVVQTWLPQMDVFGGLGALGARVPWVIAERSSEFAYVQRWKDRTLRSRIGRFASAIVANSQAGSDYWARRGVTERRLHIVSNALSFTELDAASALPVSELSHDLDAPIIAYAGRLSVEKRLDVLVDALGKVFCQSNAVAVIAGDGPLKDELRQRVADRGLAHRVRFLGYRQDIWSVLKTAHIFVSLSDFEGRPNAVLEAMACECSIVVSDIPAHREFLDSSTAFFVNQNPRDVSEAILALLSNRELARARASAGLAAVRRFSVDAAVAGYERVYRDIVRSR
jgi:glycosyltransferase involved in cell wall biosynthesis